MRIEVTHGVSRIARAGRFCCVKCCLFQAASVNLLFRSFPLPFPPSLVDSVSISISTDLVRVTVPGRWWPLAELPWRPVCSAHGLWRKVHCLPQNCRPLRQAPSPSSSTAGYAFTSHSNNNNYYYYYCCCY